MKSDPPTMPIGFPWNERIRQELINRLLRGTLPYGANKEADEAALCLQWWIKDNA